MFIAKRSETDSTYLKQKQNNTKFFTRYCKNMTDIDFYMSMLHVRSEIYVLI